MGCISCQSSISLPLHCPKFISSSRLTISIFCFPFVFILSLNSSSFFNCLSIVLSDFLTVTFLLPICTPLTGFLETGFSGYFIALLL
ncbi:hypothetical protein C1645_775571 [Glomus cerebriforme]|uniref:Uncharacterized protein n=1 Tax=Glomus cerebriforme TaxID=658196 RepID=A0A397SPW1_9GLOM|nr:hypothetical protein C1645_775571 [Glomus cerebriforme]